MEESWTWEYDLEVPKSSFACEFTRAGIKVEREYTIGTDWALRFLPKHHYIRRFFRRLKNGGHRLDDFM